MFLDFLEVRLYWENFHVVSARVRPSGSASERTCCLIRLTYAFRKYLATVRALDMGARRARAVAINSTWPAQLQMKYIPFYPLNSAGSFGLDL